MEIKTNIADVIRQLETYRNTLQDRMRIFLKRVADLGVEVAQASYSTAKYDGDNDVKVSTDWVSDSTIRVVASGSAVLFIEFGSGYQLGFGHEKAAEMGYGPGTWSEGPEGKGHWLDPNGWYFRHGEKSVGNPPSRSMVEASAAIREKIAEIAREVFQND